MRPALRYTLAVLGTSLLVASCATNPPPREAGSIERAAAELSAQDIAAIRATSERWVNAIRERRWDDAAATYTQDAVLWFGQDEFEGRESIREALQAMGPFPPSFDLHLEEIEGRGDMAFVSGHATVTSEDGQPMEAGQYLDVRVRQPDGTWLFYRDMVIPPAGAAGTPKP